MNRIAYFFIILLLPGFTTGFSQDNNFPFAGEIRQFREIDKANPPLEHAILFIGSSSFRMWKDMQDYFPGFNVINRGFGGSTLLDQIRYADDIIFPYSPRQIVIYCGENDLASGDTVSSEIVAERFKTLFTLIRTKLQDVRITYVTMKPSPSRWNLAEKFTEANKSICEFLISQPNTGFVDIWDSMLNEDQVPNPDIFLEDILHMNAEGYRIWQKKIIPELIN